MDMTSPSPVSGNSRKRGRSSDIPSGGKRSGSRKDDDIERDMDRDDVVDLAADSDDAVEVKSKDKSKGKAIEEESTPRRSARSAKGKKGGGEMVRIRVGNGEDEGSSIREMEGRI